MGSDGAPILPWHPYTAASQRPVPPGALTRYDIEVFPTFATIPAGWRLRVTITTADTPHLEPTIAQLPSLVGGVYQVSLGRSFLNVPLAARWP
jgi:predicted acyl esterase